MKERNNKKHVRVDTSMFCNGRDSQQKEKERRRRRRKKKKKEEKKKKKRSLYLILSSVLSSTARIIDSPKPNCVSAN